MILNLSSGPRRGLVLAALVAVLAVAVPVAPAAASVLVPTAAPAAASAPPPVSGFAQTAADPQGAAWALETVDNAHGVGRGNYAYDVEPGDVIEDSLLVTNTGGVALDLGVYAADAYTTPEGVLDLRLADEPKVDSGAWIALGTSSAVLQPGQSAEVPFVISVPVDARPGDHPGGIVTSSVSSTAGETLAVDRRLGIRVHLRVAGELHPSIDVTDVASDFQPSWNPFDGGTFSVSYTLVNTGDTRVTANDAVAVTGPLGLGGAALTPQATAEVLPGSSIVVTREVASVAPLGWLGGSLTVAPAAVGVGAEVLDAVTVDVSSGAISWSLLALLVLVIAAALAVVLVVVRRRRRAASADAGTAGGRTVGQ